MKKHILLFLILLFLVIPAFVWILQKSRPIARGLSYRGEQYQGDFKFLYDLSYQSKEGEKEVKQEIYETMFSEIEKAEEFILLDLFLFNDDYDRSTGLEYPSLSWDVCNALIKKKEKNPKVEVVVITDPINSVYGSYKPKMFKAMEDKGIQVVTTNLDQVKDSNPLYSNLYRAYFQWIPHSKEGSLPNLFNSQKPKATLASYFSLLNFKANHRKVFTTEQKAIITSANPHDGSYYHSNIGVLVSGPIIDDIIACEKAVIEISNGDKSKIGQFKARSTSQGESSLQILTEGKIQEELLRAINDSQEASEIMIGVFYLSDRHIIDALKEAADRGVSIRLVLDQNKDAFGKKKIGIPNKQVAQELMEKKNINIRWYETQGEQYHAKFLIAKNPKTTTFIGGSANFTRRNLDDLNLETDIRIEGETVKPELQKILAYYEKIWTNEDGIYTVDYEKYGEDKLWKNLIYWVQEQTGLSTF